MSDENEDLTGRVIGASLAVHKHLGPGLLESAYEACLAIELTHLAIPFERQKPLPIHYCGQAVDAACRLDFVINQELILELKSVDRFEPIHTAQVLTPICVSPASGLPCL
jgi:GxxExxY protein